MDSMIFLFALIGFVIGSFLNVCVDRLPVRKSLVHPSSYCDVCFHSLSYFELIPIISYIWQRGRCRHCMSFIAIRVFYLELLSGFIFAYTYTKYGLCLNLFVITFTIYLFLVIMFIDKEHKLILNRIIFPSMLFFLLLLTVNFCFPQIELLNNVISTFRPAIGSAIFSCFVAVIFFLLILLINPKGMGMGDIKLAGLIGLVTGFPLVIVALIMGILTAGLMSVVLILTGIKGYKDEIPLGAFLAFGTIFTLLWGGEILNYIQ